MEPTQLATQTAPRIPVTWIVRGRNPRTEFPEKEMEELTLSVKAVGVFTPILLRPTDDGKLQIVAGERRYQATIRAFGLTDDVTIPADIRILTDEEADNLALIENTERQPMTPLDEAEAAARTLGNCGGNRDEAARVLGWEPHRLAMRLGLMYAVPEARDALRKKDILLGHAELLAGLRKESQIQALAMLMSSPERPSVTDFKAMLQRMALSLSTAIFPKDDCAGCQHNSGTQGALFGESIADGNCTNKVCFEAKSEAEIERRAQELRNDYQVVKIVRPGDNFTIVGLQAEGPKGVGVDQAAACRSCESFGAAVSGMPDSMGRAYRDQCMNTACNIKMVAIRIKADKEAQELAAGPATNPGSTADVKGNKGATSGATKPSPAKKPTTPSAASIKPSAAVVTFREKVWRAIFSRVVINADAATNRCILFALAVTNGRCFEGTLITAHAEKHGLDVKGSSAASVLEKTLNLQTADLSKVLGLVAGHTSSMLLMNDVVAMLKVLDVKIGDHWAVSTEFFDILTKNEIDAVCADIGIKQALAGAYAKAYAGKKDEYIKTIMGIEGDFDYKNRIPKIMNW